MHGRGEQQAEMFQLLKPSVIAWGSDPVRQLGDMEPFRNMLKDYEEKGIILNASNVWILTATNRVYHDDPRYQEAVCVDIEGVPIIPFWREDAFYKGVPGLLGMYQSSLVSGAGQGTRDCRDEFGGHHAAY